MKSVKIFGSLILHFQNPKHYALRKGNFIANCRYGTTLEGKGEIFLKKAEVGNIIEFKDGLQGIVEKVNENSVIVDLSYMENYQDLELNQRTVVNHKNYKIIYS